MHIILVLGIRLLRSGNPEDVFVASILRGVEILNFYREDGQLVISGGVTRLQFCSEARAALAYIPEGLHSKVLLEEQAESTRQNVQNVRKLLAATSFDSIHVIGTPAHVASARELFEAEWPKALSRFYPEPVGEENFWDNLTQRILRIPRRVDPRERFFLPLRKLLIRWGFS